MTPGDWLALVFVLVGLIVRHASSGVDDEEASRYIRWYRSKSQTWQIWIDSVLLGIGALWTKFYVDVVFVSYFGSGVVELAIGIVLSLIGTGLGFSAGKALTEREYSMFRQPDSRGQAAVDPIAPGLLIIGIVASLVIAELLAVWPADLTRASETVITPCYYFCGPWYTWLPVILFGVAAVVVIVSFTMSKLSGGDHDSA